MADDGGTYLELSLSANEQRNLVFKVVQTQLLSSCQPATAIHLQLNDHQNMQLYKHDLLSYIIRGSEHTCVRKLCTCESRPARRCWISCISSFEVLRPNSNSNGQADKPNPWKIQLQCIFKFPLENLQVFIIESRQLDYRVLHQHKRTNQSETTKRKENASLPICNSKFLCTQRTMTKTQTSTLNERFSFPSCWANASKLRHSSVFLKGPWWKSKNALKITNNT